jgi:periplasmic divalent cation tolerance protein
MEHRFVYVTAADEEEARTIARCLVSERLVACVNILTGMSSMYWWQGEVQEDREVVLIAKTTADLARRVVERVVEVHSYETPCVVTLPILEGNPGFLAWIDAETRAADGV